MIEQAYEQLTLFQGDFHASLSVMPGSVEARKTTVSSGQKCCALLEKSSQLGLLGRMLLESSIWHSMMCFLTWKVKATKRRRLLFQLAVSMPRTGANESLLLPTPTATVADHGGPNQRDSSGRPGLQMAARFWPTPTSRDHKDGTAESCKNVPVNGLLGRAVHFWQTPNVPNGGRVNPVDMSPTGKMPDGRKRQVGLEHQVRMVTAGLWPTPTVNGNNNRKGSSAKAGDGLATAVKMWPTPHASCYTGTSESQEGAPNLQTEVGGKLNPMWVEWLMGFPIGWTDLDV